MVSSETVINQQRTAAKLQIWREFLLRAMLDVTVCVLMSLGLLVFSSFSYYISHEA